MSSIIAAARGLLASAVAFYRSLPEVRIVTGETLEGIRRSGRRYRILNGRVLIYPPPPPPEAPQVRRSASRLAAAGAVRLRQASR